jgi:hypothetical protein
MQIVIAGLAKTGTTGLFYKLKNSLPEPARELFETTVYEPKPGDGDRDVLAKILIGRESYADYDSFDRFDKKICIVRDPRDRLISSFLYRTYVEPFVDDEAKCAEFIDLLRQKEADGGSVSVQRLCQKQDELSGRPAASLRASFDYFVGPLAWVGQFCERHPGYFVYKYEDFVSGEFTALEEYMGFALDGGASVDARVERVARTRGLGDWRNWFLPEDVERLRNDKTVTEYMARFGYADDWELPAAPVIKPEHGSQYVERITLEQRNKRQGHSPQGVGT